jgi:hypothetical protein
MNWILVLVIVGVASSERTVNVTTIPMQSERLCIEGSDKLKKAYQMTDAANWMLVSQCLQVRGD